jgi:D-aminoacyl-tRNA deacylase
MRAVCQRVSGARVSVGDEVVGEIGAGLVVLLGVRRGDTTADGERLAAKIASLRIFDNDDGKFDRSLSEVGGSALVVSQFTLLADTSKGNRPSFGDAAPPEEAESLYDSFSGALAGAGIPLARGVFGARMALELVNDGPVTIILESPRGIESGPAGPSKSPGLLSS